MPGSGNRAFCPSLVQHRNYSISSSLFSADFNGSKFYHHLQRVPVLVCGGKRTKALYSICSVCHNKVGTFALEMAPTSSVGFVFKQNGLGTVLVKTTCRFFKFRPEALTLEESHWVKLTLIWH